MDETFTSEAIVLDRQDFREHDGRVMLYSPEQGKFELVVRGMKKPGSKMAGHIEPLTCVRFMAVKGKYFSYMGSAVGYEYFSGIRSDWDLIKTAGDGIRFFKSYVKPDDITDAGSLYELLHGFLGILNLGQLKADSLEFAYQLFIYKLLSATGNQPELNSCVVCGEKLKENGNFFNPVKGGIVCFKHNRDNKGVDLTISGECIKVLRLAVKCRFETIFKLKISKKLQMEFNNIVCTFKNFIL